MLSRRKRARCYLIEQEDYDAVTNVHKTCNLYMYMKLYDRIRISAWKIWYRNVLYFANDSLVIAWNRGVFNTVEAPLTTSKEGASNPSEDALIITSCICIARNVKSDLRSWIHRTVSVITLVEMIECIAEKCATNYHPLNIAIVFVSFSKYLYKCVCVGACVRALFICIGIIIL